jgi:hypothetical protein
MTPINISGIHGRSNPYYSVLSGSLRLFSCHGGELRGLCQLPIYPIAHQYGIGARQLHACEAVLRVPRRVLHYEAVGLPISLLQKANPSFPRTSGPYRKCVSRGRWHTTGVTLRELSPSPCIAAETLRLRSGVGEEWNT